MGVMLTISLARPLHSENSTRPLTVCFVIDRLSRAGTETQLLALIRCLDRDQIQPVLCLLDGTDEESRSLEPENCPILRLGLKGLVRKQTPSAALKLRRFWREHRVDIVQTYFLDSGYLAIPLAKACGIRRVLRVRNNVGYWLTRKHRLLGRLMSLLTSATLTNSEEGREAIHRVEGEGTRVEVITNGVDLDRFSQRRPPDVAGQVVRIGAVANLRPIKNIASLIRAATVLREQFPQVKFEVAGEGDQRPELEAQIRAAGLQDTFRLIGPVRDVPRFLESLDIAVLCSLSESMSNALLEYMAAGRAIVATDVGANGHLVRHGEEGLIVSPGDDLALVEVLTTLLHSPERCQQFGQAARRRVEEHYSRAAMVKRFEEFYRGL